MKSDFIPAGDFIIEDGFIPSERTDLVKKLLEKSQGVFSGVSNGTRTHGLQGHNLTL